LANRRFIVPKRPDVFVAPEAAYDDFVLCGEAANWNRKSKCDLALNRAGDHRLLANYFRLYLHAEGHKPAII
jgi:hypothetical protein